MKTILITGASSGIGLACVYKLQNGNKLVLCSRNLDKLHNIQKDLKASGEEVMAFEVAPRGSVPRMRGCGANPCLSVKECMVVSQRPA